MGDHKRSQSAYEAVLENDPKSLDALRGLAALSLDRSDVEQSLEYHGRLVDLGERTPELLYNTALLYQKSGQLKEAARLYRDALAENPEFPEALLNLGHVLKALEARPELAQGYFEAAK